MLGDYVLKKQVRRSSMSCIVAIAIMINWAIVTNFLKFDERNKRVSEELKSLEDQLADLSKKLKDCMSKKQVAGKSEFHPHNYC